MDSDDKCVETSGVIMGESSITGELKTSEMHSIYILVTSAKC